jgi:hypothetical protein
VSNKYEHNNLSQSSTILIYDLGINAQESVILNTSNTYHTKTKGKILIDIANILTGILLAYGQSYANP